MGQKPPAECFASAIPMNKVSYLLMEMPQYSHCFAISFLFFFLLPERYWYPIYLSIQANPQATAQKNLVFIKLK